MWEPAEAFVEQVFRLPPPFEADLIWEETQKEVAKKYREEPRTREAIDEIFGKGRWRPIRRFIIHQNGRSRLIDDGSWGGQNKQNTEDETIYTTSVDYILELLSVAVEFMTDQKLEELLEELLPNPGTDDLSLIHISEPTRPY